MKVRMIERGRGIGSHMAKVSVNGKLNGQL